MSRDDGARDGATTQAPVRTPVRRGPGGGGPFGGMTMPGDKSMNFGPSAKRLGRRLRPEMVGLVFVTLLAVVSVVFAVLGPKLLGNAINLVFAGAISSQLPKGITQAQAIAGLRANGQGQLADLISGMTLTPGQGIDFVELFQEDGFVTGSAPITEICAPIGVMRRQMAIWLNSSPRAADGNADAGGWR